MPLTKKSKMKRHNANKSAKGNSRLKKQTGRTNLLKGLGGGIDSSSIANPVRKRANAIDNSASSKKGKQAESVKRVDTKIDFATGRVLFPVETNGKVQYLPVESEANDFERKNGIFVSEDSIKKDAVNTLDVNAERDTLHDVQNQRQLFATLDANGKQEYLPSESDADALELANGKYIPDDVLTAPSVALGLLDIDANKTKQQLVYDFTNQRNLFAVRTADGKDINVPVKSKATASELKRGLYIDDGEISKKIDLSPAKALTNDPARLDAINQRMVFAAKDENGKTVYFPKQSEANALELARGLFIPDDIVIEHEFNRRQTALKHRDDAAEQQLARAKRASNSNVGVVKSTKNDIKPITRAKDGTQIWDGFSIPSVSEDKQRDTLRKLKPKYDLNENRMLYPTVNAKGKTKYLPLLKDATDVERLSKNYAAFVPVEPLSALIGNAQIDGDLERQYFDTEQGEIRGFAKADIDKVFAGASNFTLRSAHLVSEAAKMTPQFAQQQHSNQKEAQQSKRI